MSCKAVIFDLDGTLIDSMSIWSDVDVEFLEKRGIDLNPELFKDVPEGNSFKELAQYVKDKFTLEESIEEICAEWTEMVKSHYERRIDLRKGVRELLEYLHTKGVLMGIGTSNSMELTRLVLNRHKISDYFQVVVSGDSHLRGKPYPDIFLEAARSMHSLPEECVVIEDTLAGVLSAKAAKMKVIAIEEKESAKEWEKIQEKADCNARSFQEVLSYLQGIVR